MTMLKFKTNVNCGGCVAKITPYLNQVKGIITWEVDTSNLSRIMTVEVMGIGPNEIIKAMIDAGYKADLIIAE